MLVNYYYCYSTARSFRANCAYNYNVQPSFSKDSFSLLFFCRTLWFLFGLSFVVRIVVRSAHTHWPLWHDASTSYLYSDRIQYWFILMHNYLCFQLTEQCNGESSEAKAGTARPIKVSSWIWRILNSLGVLQFLFFFLF